MARRVLILQHIWDNHKGSIGALLDEYAIEHDVVDVEHETLPDPRAYAAVIALGGHQHVYEARSYPYLVKEQELLCELVRDDIPYLGICLGAQMLAASLCGQVRRHTMTEIGFFDVQLTPDGSRDPLYADLPGYQRVFHWHEDTFTLPPEGVLLATSPNTTNQAFRYGKRAYGLQYHIEVDDATLDTWLYHPACRASIVDSIGIDGYATIEQERSSHFATYHYHTRILFRNFLKLSQLV